MENGVVDQELKAERAEETAASTSSFEATGTGQRVSRVEGFVPR